MVDQTVLLRQLRELPPEQWNTIQARVTAFHKLGCTSSPTYALGRSSDSDEDYLLTGIYIELRRRGLLGRNATIPPSAWPSKFKKTSAEVRQNIQFHFDRQLSPVEQAALGRLCGQTLAAYLEKRGIPISPNSMLSSVGKIPLALDHAFPGYLASGLLAYCWHG